MTDNVFASIKAWNLSEFRRRVVGWPGNWHRQTSGIGVLPVGDEVLSPYQVSGECVEHLARYRGELAGIEGAEAFMVVRDVLR